MASTFLPSPALRPNVASLVESTFVYGGDFRTMDWRSGNLGVTEVRPYWIDGAWRAGLLVTVQQDF